MKILNDILTGKDGATHDIIRWLAVISCFVGLGLEIYSVVIKAAAFDLEKFGIGVGVLFASAGAALKLKESTEP